MEALADTGAGAILWASDGGSSHPRDQSAKVADLREAVHAHPRPAVIRAWLVGEAAQVQGSPLPGELGGEVRVGVLLGHHRREIGEARLWLLPVHAGPVDVLQPRMLLHLYGPPGCSQPARRVCCKKATEDSLRVVQDPCRIGALLPLDAALDHCLVVALVVWQGAREQAIQQTSQTIVIQRESMPLSANHLWAKVPRSSNKRREYGAVARQAFFGEAEVGQPDVTIGTQKAVLWLQISIKDLLRVQVLQPEQDLAEEKAGVALGKTPPLLHVEEQLSA
mmetsp:Transcript_106450/g.297054  ORF Transcript_106450/g.297054 Transcript_106450/m.297054 type:complete len:279 (+) Transcript_106450:118-954(+)